MPVVIRTLEDTDVPAVVVFSLRAWEPIYASFRDVLGERTFTAVYPDWRSSQQREIERTCRSARTSVWVAEIDLRLVGFVAVLYDEATRAGEIDMLAVDPNMQRQGVGTALTQFAMNWFVDRGASTAVVATGGEAGHAPARAVYERAGFQPLPLVRYYKRLD